VVGKGQVEEIQCVLSEAQCISKIIEADEGGNRTGGLSLKVGSWFKISRGEAYQL